MHPGQVTTPEHAQLRELEVSRLRALVDRDMGTARRLHADDYVLITPRGARLSKSEYLDAVASGELAYNRFEAVSEVEVLIGDRQLAVLRYMSAIDVGIPVTARTARAAHGRSRNNRAHAS